MSEPDADPEPVASQSRSARQSIVLLLAVFFVAAASFNLWPDEGHVASSAEATGISADAVIASLAAERREHSARAATTRALESATPGAPTSGKTQPQTSGGKAGSKDEEQGQAATTSPQQPTGGGSAPAKGNLTLPVVGETPLPDPGLPEVPAVELPAVPAPPAVPEVPEVPLPPVPSTPLP